MCCVSASIPSCMYLSLSIYLSIYPSSHLAFHPFIHPSSHPSTDLHTYLHTYKHARLSLAWSSKLHAQDSMGSPWHRISSLPPGQPHHVLLDAVSSWPSLVRYVLSRCSSYLGLASDGQQSRVAVVVRSSCEAMLPPGNDARDVPLLPLLD